ncbi:hypothetical protein JNUCC31_16465 [Paenibacillus sp. JNUCC31]|nr:hypothetical protein [Paenibacillus sp. JNUCC-31]QOS76459.1 hypothetical protein JNUCC31_16465 [Paenibacillus sp. JNUCC-31]
MVDLHGFAASLMNELVPTIGDGCRFGRGVPLQSTLNGINDIPERYKRGSFDDQRLVLPGLLFTINFNMNGLFQRCCGCCRTELTQNGTSNQNECK